MKNVLFIAVLAFTTSYSLAQPNNAGTAAEREALFNYIIEKTKIREARSDFKEERLAFDPILSMQRLKEEVVSADTDEKLFYALKKLNAARRDRHLSVRTVEGGLVLSTQVQGIAPIRFHPDFSNRNDIFFFVADISKDINKYANSVVPKVGDKLISINGEDINAYIARAQVYIRHSNIENFLRRFAYDLSARGELLPPSFYQEDLTLILKPKRGKDYMVVLKYQEVVDWRYTRTLKNYNGFSRVKELEFDTYELYTADDLQNKTLLLWWYGFRGDLPESIDALVVWAEKENKLDYDLIIDAIDSRGGSQGAYALARLSPMAFKTTGGNLKLSDITYDFISSYTNRYVSKQVQMDHDSRETEDDGTWVIDWLNGPVLKGLTAGQEYSNNVPFKCAHLPHYSDWMMQPAKKHFKGKMVVLLGPWGGSHLSQFAAMVIDNNMGHTLGMTDGGYSNTWEWTEVLKFPGTDKPVVSFMWNIGHTIRPNGQILEGNPAIVDEYIPVTKDNYLDYKNILLGKAHDWLGQDKIPPVK